MIISVVLGFVTQGYVNRAYRRWSQVQLATGKTGAEVARVMLDSEGLRSVGIEVVPGNLTDHYDPRANVLRLSEGVHSSASVAAAGVAARNHAVSTRALAAVRMALVRPRASCANRGSRRAWHHSRVAGTTAQVIAFALASSFSS
jgi:Zn-dependent membrane protease YugP